MLESEIKDLKRKNVYLINESVALRKQVIELEKKVGDPSEVIAKLLGRSIKWKDTSKMSKEVYNLYYKEAQSLLQNEVFENEINACIVDLVNDIAKHTSDFQEVLNRRFTINGLLLLKERIESLAKVEDEEDEEYDEASM